VTPNVPKVGFLGVTGQHRPARSDRKALNTMTTRNRHRRRAALLLTVSAAWMLFAATRSQAAVVPGVGHHVLAAATLDQVISNVRTWIVGILASLATVFLTIGGARYVIAGGDPAEVEKAKTSLKSAAFGYALAILAPGLVAILQHLVGA
jgi:hypothetical protein